MSAIQDNWLQWDSAFQRGEEGSAGIAIDDLLQAAGELGMSRLPEVCSAVLARATISAADGGTPRARWALDMAERLDPGRPEVEFARAAVARHEGRYLAMVWSELRRLRALASVPLFWRLTLENLLIWAIAAVVVAGALFVALQLAVHGASLIDDIAEIVSRKRPITTAYLAALVVFILPVLVPAAWVVLPLYWAILLLPYARPSERAVIATVVAALIATPFLLRRRLRRVAVELSPPMEATRSLAERRLYGGLISDVEAVRTELPNSPAAIHVLADLQQDLGQIEYARLLYQRLIDVEPLNVAAHNNIGVYYQRRRETSQAIEHLERAASIDESADRAAPQPVVALPRLPRVRGGRAGAGARARGGAQRRRQLVHRGRARRHRGDARRLRRAARDPLALRSAWKPGALEPAASFSIGQHRRGRGLPRDRRSHRLAAAAATAEPAGGSRRIGAAAAGAGLGPRDSARCTRATAGARSSPSSCRCRSSCSSRA